MMWKYGVLTFFLKGGVSTSLSESSLSSVSVLGLRCRGDDSSVCRRGDCPLALFCRTMLDTTCAATAAAEEKERAD